MKMSRSFIGGRLSILQCGIPRRITPRISRNVAFAPALSRAGDRSPPGSPGAARRGRTPTGGPPCAGRCRAARPPRAGAGRRRSGGGPARPPSCPSAASRARASSRASRSSGTLGQGDVQAVEVLACPIAAVLGGSACGGRCRRGCGAWPRPRRRRSGRGRSSAVPRSASDQAQVGLVDQGGGLERLARLLLGQPLRRQLAQLVVDQRQQLLGGVRVALLDGRQDAGHVAHRRCTSRGTHSLVATRKAANASIVAGEDGISKANRIGCVRSRYSHRQLRSAEPHRRASSQRGQWLELSTRAGRIPQRIVLRSDERMALRSPQVEIR